MTGVQTCALPIYQKGEAVRVAAILPTQAFAVVGNQELEPLAKEVEEILKKVIDSL